LAKFAGGASAKPEPGNCGVQSAEYVDSGMAPVRVAACCGMPHAAVPC
jgi:hypothetical protein